MVVEHGLFDRDRERLVSAEANCVGELARVVDRGALEHADAGPAAADAEADVLARQVSGREEGGDLVGQRLGVPHLACDDDVRRKCVAGGLHELRPAVVHDDGCRELGRADAEPDELLVPAVRTRRGSLRLLRLALRRLFLLRVVLRWRGGLCIRRRLALEGHVLLQEFGKAHCAAPATRRPRRASGRCSSVRGATPLRASSASNSSRRLVTLKAVS